MPATGARLYLPPWRGEVTSRGGVPRLVPRVRLGRCVARTLAAAGAPSPAAVGVILAGDRELSALNRRHLGARGPTDVLSFPLLPASAFPPHDGAPPGRGAAAGAGGGAAPFALPPGSRLHLGEVIVSVERAIDQARSGRGGQDGTTLWSPAEELLLLVTHGTLHLCGWDHADPEEERAMRALERELLAEERAGR